MAPEIKEKIEMTDRKSMYCKQAIDIWSLCVTFICLATLKQPESPLEFIEASKGLREFRSMEGYSDNFRNIILQGLKYNPEERISLQNLLNLCKG
jgi:serine/threonine protein kinase